MRRENVCDLQVSAARKSPQPKIPGVQTPRVQVKPPTLTADSSLIVCDEFVVRLWLVNGIN